jgi:hypothetical protein
MRQRSSMGLATFGVVFFIGVAVLLDLFFVAVMHDYWFGRQPSYGIGILVLAALNVVAAFGAWRTKAWGYIAAIVLSLLVVLATFAGIGLGGATIGGSVSVFYTSIIIFTKLLVVFFAIGALMLQRADRS